MENATPAPFNATKWRTLATLALIALVASIIARNTITQPPAAKGWELLYWFTAHVFFDGPLLVLVFLALTPRRDNLPVKWLIPILGAILLLGSMFSLLSPIFLTVIGILLGLAIKAAPESEPLFMVMAIAGLGLGVPLNGFTGLLAAKTNFQPQLMNQLFGSTQGVGSAAIATAITGIFLLIHRLIENRSSCPQVSS